MKNQLISLFALMGLIISANSQTTLSQTTDNSVVALNSVACQGSAVADNFFIRVFDLAGLGYSQFDVVSVTFGIEDTTIDAGDVDGFDLTINIYSKNAADALTFANLTLVNSVTVPALEAHDLVLRTEPIIASVVADELVVAIVTPDETTSGFANFFQIGSNPNGQSGLSYIASTACGIAEPTDLAVIGFPDMHIVVDVTGNETLSLNEAELTKVAISPNPTKDLVHIKLHPSNSVKMLELFNLTGQLVYRAFSENQLNMSNLSNGVYMLQIETENGSATKRIVKQ